MNYPDLVARLAAEAGIDPATDDTWATMLPHFIETAETRCYRDVSFLCAIVRKTVQVGPGVATLTAPTDWLVGQRIEAALGSAFAGMDRRDATYLAEFGPATGQPRLWAEPTAGQIVLWPTPDRTYALRLTYEGRPPPLSADSFATWLTTNAPDLLFAACMSAVTAYQKNFGAQADNPQAAMSWEAAYANALTSVKRQEGRRKGDGTFDSSPSPPPPSNAPSAG